MRKGFIFTLDALFAVLMLAVFLAVISIELNVPKHTYWLPELGDTFMTSLDKSGVLYSTYLQSPSDAQNTLTYYLNTLPANTNAKLTIRVYTGGAGDTFSGPTTIEATKGIISPLQETHVKRVFCNITNKKFGIAELVLSYA